MPPSIGSFSWSPNEPRGLSSDPKALSHPTVRKPSSHDRHPCPCRHPLWPVSLSRPGQSGAYKRCSVLLAGWLEAELPRKQVLMKRVLGPRRVGEWDTGLWRMTGQEAHVVEPPPVTKRARLHQGEGWSGFHSSLIQERLKTANSFLPPSLALPTDTHAPRFLMLGPPPARG